MNSLIILSNIGFIIAIIILINCSVNKSKDLSGSAINKNIIPIILLTLVFLFSVWYHSLEIKYKTEHNITKTIIGYADVLISVILLIYVITRKGLHYNLIVLSILFLFWIGSYLTRNRNEYILYHSIWHCGIGIYVGYLLCGG
jgi:hypothetical protein